MGRDVVGAWLSYRQQNYNLDLPGGANFQKTAMPNIASGNRHYFYVDTNKNRTNDGGGLVPGGPCYQLRTAQIRPARSNVISLFCMITDGRPSAVTGSFDARPTLYVLPG